MEIKNINKNIGKKEIIKDINLSLDKGKIYGFIGPNGSGKSMLFKILAEWITEDNKQSFKYTHREFIEDINLRLDKSGYDNLINLYNNPDKVNKYLNLFGMEKVKYKKMSTYSLGMKQKIAIIQVLLEDVDVLILDEPFNGLDKKSCNILMYVLNEKRKEGKIILLTSHIQIYLEKLADYFYYIKDGKIIKKEQNKLKEEKFKLEKFEEKIILKKKLNFKKIQKILAIILILFIIIYIINGRIKLYNANKLYNDGKYKEAYNEIIHNTYYLSNTSKKIIYTGYEICVLESYSINKNLYDSQSILQSYLIVKELINNIEEKNKIETKKYRLESNEILLKNYYPEIIKQVEEKLDQNKDEILLIAKEEKKNTEEKLKIEEDKILIKYYTFRIKILEELIFNYN